MDNDCSNGTCPVCFDDIQDIEEQEYDDQE